MPTLHSWQTAWRSRTQHKLLGAARALSGVFSVGYDCTNKDGSEILADDSPLGVIFRIYLEPPTSIGAAFPEVVYDRLIKFTPVGSP